MEKNIIVENKRMQVHILISIISFLFVLLVIVLMIRKVKFAEDERKFAGRGWRSRGRRGKNDPLLTKVRGFVWI